MNIDNLDRVIALRNYRSKLAALHATADWQKMVCTFDDKDIASHIDTNPIRDFIRSQMMKQIREWEAELRRLGVEVEEYK